ncbi:MAG: hypothetical protein IKL13_02650 [Clostridia bacterium]|nr:hypothetical protein [Clostridia bacterium]
MNANDLINAIGSIDDRYVLAYTAGATPHKRKPVTPLFRWSAAACVAVVAALSLMLLPTMTRHHSVMPKPDHTPTPPDSGGQMSPLPDAPATTTTTAGGDGFSNNELVTTTTHPTVSTPTTGDAGQDEPPEPSGDVVYLNKVDGFISTAADWGYSVQASQEEFAATYPLDLTTYGQHTGYDIINRLRYVFNEEPYGPIRSQLMYGTISILANSTAASSDVVFSLTVSKERFERHFGCVVMQAQKKEISRINGHEVLLMHGIHYDNPRIVGELKVGDLYITFSSYRPQEEVVELLRYIIDAITNPGSESEGSPAVPIPNPSATYTFTFGSYEELWQALTDAANDRYKELRENAQAYGTLYQNTLSAFAAGEYDLIVPRLNGSPIPIREEMYYAQVSLITAELYHLPWLWYHCTVEDRDLTVKISYTEAIGSTAVNAATSYAEVVDLIYPNAPSPTNYAQYPNYKIIYEQELTLADGSRVAAWVSEVQDNDRVYIKFYKDSVLVSMWADGDLFSDAFWSGFDLATYTAP